jgi:hypothetical protein
MKRNGLRAKKPKSARAAWRAQANRDSRHWPGALARLDRWHRAASRQRIKR